MFRKGHFSLIYIKVRWCRYVCVKILLTESWISEQPHVCAERTCSVTGWVGGRGFSKDFPDLTSLIYSSVRRSEYLPLAGITFHSNMVVAR